MNLCYHDLSALNNFSYSLIIMLTQKLQTKLLWLLSCIQYSFQIIVTVILYTVFILNYCACCLVYSIHFKLLWLLSCIQYSFQIIVTVILYTVFILNYCDCYLVYSIHFKLLWLLSCIQYSFQIKVYRVNPRQQGLISKILFDFKINFWLKACSLPFYKENI